MRRATLALAMAAAVTCALALGGASPAMADATHSIDLSVPSTGYVDTPLLIQATGSNPDPSQWWDLSYIEVVAIPGSVLSTCPDNAQDGGQIAETAGGEILTIALQPNENSLGNYSNQIGFTPWARGSVLICGYEYNDVGTTLAVSFHSMDVHCSCELQQQDDPAPQSAPAPQGGGSSPAPAANAVAAKPKNTKRPRVARSAKSLVCYPGSWTDATGFSYRWLVNGKQKKGASGRSLGITRRLRGRNVKCGVTASNAGGSASALSKALRVGK